MTDPTHAALKQAAHELDIAENALLCSSFHNAAIRAKQAAMTARAALSQPEPDVDDILQLAAIIRKVDGNNSLGAAALAEEILSHPHSRWTADRAQRHPAPVPTVEGEVGELIKCLRIRAASLSQVGANLSQQGDAIYFTRAADLLEQRHPTPVPVSERLPGPEDCDAEGRCWLRRKHQLGGPTWWLARPASIGTEALRIYYAEWLPAHALPLPGEVEG